MSHSCPTVSVIIPSFNQGKYLDDCLRSVVSRKPDEIIVMDGGSSDHSVEIIKRYESHLTYWQSRPDGGQAAAVNAGVARATGDIIAWLNSDDVWLPQTLSAIRSTDFSAHSGLIGSSFWASQDLKTIHHKASIQKLSQYALSKAFNLVDQPSSFFKKDVWAEVGNLDETLQFGLDYDFIIRVSLSRFASKVRFVKMPLSINRVHHDMKSQDPRMSEELVEVRNRYFNPQLNTPYGDYFSAFGLGILRVYRLRDLIAHAFGKLTKPDGLPGRKMKSIELSSLIPE